jgi:hypothetical protein
VRGAVIVGRHPKTFTFPDLGARNRDVRFTPMTGHRRLIGYVQKPALGLFDHLVGAQLTIPPSFGWAGLFGLGMLQTHSVA